MASSVSASVSCALDKPSSGLHSWMAFIMRGFAMFDQVKVGGTDENLHTLSPWRICLSCKVNLRRNGWFILVFIKIYHKKPRFERGLIFVPARF